MSVKTETHLGAALPATKHPYDEEKIDLLSAQDISRRTQLSLSEVFSLIEDGTIPSISVGRAVRVRWSAYKKWLASLRRGDRSQFRGKRKGARKEKV